MGERPIRVIAKHDYKSGAYGYFAGGTEYELTADVVAGVNLDSPGTFETLADKPKPVAKRGTPNGAQNRAMKSPGKDR